MAYTDEQIMAAVRRYAAEHGALNGQVRWDRWAVRHHLPTTRALIFRFGSLKQLAELAGVAYQAGNAGQGKRRPDAARRAFVAHHLARIAASPPLDDAERARIRRRIDAELARLKGVCP
jgi:hypothetical protein